MFDNLVFYRASFDGMKECKPLCVIKEQSQWVYSVCAQTKEENSSHPSILIASGSRDMTGRAFHDECWPWLPPDGDNSSVVHGVNQGRSQVQARDSECLSWAQGLDCTCVLDS